MLHQVQNRFFKQARREYAPKQRLLALAAEAVVFLVILPLALIWLAATFDRWIGWPILYNPPINAVLGGLLILSGWLYAIWSIYVQFTIGRGTPVPLMATQKLIIQPPYAYSRNPMALGAIVLYLGVAVLVGSISAAILVLLGAGLLLTYIQRVEEKEMELRFGQDYLAYRRQTPFLLPRFRQRRR